MNMAKLILICLASAWVEIASGQATREGVRMRPIEATRDDTSPLSVRLGVIPVDLRVPRGFEKVYEISTWNGPLETRGAYARRGRLFARVDGAIVALFPRSTYESTEDGRLFATTPPGTIYSIGPPSRSLLERVEGAERGWDSGGERQARTTESVSGRVSTNASAGSAGPPAVNLSATLPAGSAAASGDAKEAVAEPSMWVSESYRRERIGELLSRALVARPVGGGKGRKFEQR